MKKPATLLALLISSIAFAKQILVEDQPSFTKTVASALPGDTIVLKNGTWKNVSLNVPAPGTEEKPIIIKAQTRGMVIISGKSQLNIGGSYLVIDGLYFTHGFAPGSAVIQFKTDNDHVAHHVRVTNCVINDFNKPERFWEDYWIALLGKYNRIDHCSFLNKKNLGVLMAVLLDDDRSRENNHSIDHNYFGRRQPLGSNAGEIIRVGVSQHCQFDSKTIISDNLFEQCDGEVEIISIKSGSNMVRNNIFKECQGDVVLRHGNNNTVYNNVFIGNGKEGTGGIRIINRGQWVVNNLFYKCRGVDFRSPLSIMNGVPNSPANRYVQVTDAVIANNSFYNCSAISFCEGSDAERSMVPEHVLFFNNAIYTVNSNPVYVQYDKIDGILFQQNLVSLPVKQDLNEGFIKTSLPLEDVQGLQWPVNKSKKPIPDSLQAISFQRMGILLPPVIGFSYRNNPAKENHYHSNTGASWFTQITNHQKQVTISCGNAIVLKKALAVHTSAALKIILTDNSYEFTEPLIAGNVTIIAAHKIKFQSKTKLPFLFRIKSGSTLSLERLDLDLRLLEADHFVESDSMESSFRFGFTMKGCIVSNFRGHRFFNAARSGFADSISIIDCHFVNNKTSLFHFANEDDKKGYYNVEQLRITGNKFLKQEGSVLNMLRGGNDESTMGPKLIFTNNQLSGCSSTTPLVELFGTQLSFILNNSFLHCNENGLLISYQDVVRARHFLKSNTIISSGNIQKNKFVIE